MYGEGGGWSGGGGSGEVSVCKATVLTGPLDSRQIGLVWESFEAGKKYCSVAS